MIILATGVVGSVGFGIAAAEEPPIDSTIGPSQTQLVLSQDDAADNETVRHRHPGQYDEPGEPSEIEIWLADRMLDNINESAAQIEDEEYDLASQYVGDGYDDYLDQYLEITDETDRDGHGEMFEAVREEQERVIDTARQYDELRDEYEQARQDGDDERARERARELEALATTANDSSTQLRDQYAELETEADANLSESDAAIETVAEDIRASQETIRDEQFVQTRLTIDPDRERISFLEPLTGVGQLHTVDGEPVRNEPVRLEIGNGSVRTETDSNGLVEFEYRPTDEPLSTERLEIEYVPANDSVYFGSETAVEVSISQVEPTVSDLETENEVAYGENATVAGELAVDDIPVDGVPLAVHIDDERIGTTETTNGSFDAAATIPATIADGERELGVRLDYEERALANTSATTPVTIRETEGALSLSTTRPENGGRTIEVTGTFETIDGEGVSDAEIRLDGDGTTLETTTTDDNGAFDARVTVPDESVGETEIVATYDGSESNVRSATARTTVPLSTTEGRSWWALPAWVWIGAGAGAIALFGIVAVLWRRSRSPDPDSRSAPEIPIEADDTPLESSSDRSRTEIARSLLSYGRDRLADGNPDEAVEIGYMAVRCALSPRVNASGASTHREFHRNWKEHRDEAPHSRSDDDALLRTVIERYEQTTFGVTTVSPEDAEAVLEAASKLCELNVRRSDSSDTSKSAE